MTRTPKRKADDAAKARLALNTKRATEALAALKRSRTHADSLAAAQQLESAACQLRRTLKAARSA
jgi:hypothetical protein